MISLIILETVNIECLLNDQYIYIEGTRKKIRGPTQKNELWDMKRTKKIVVTFNKYTKPVGDEANELTQFLGSIVRIAENVGLDCCD